MKKKLNAGKYTRNVGERKRENPKSINKEKEKIL